MSSAARAVGSGREAARTGQNPDFIRPGDTLVVVKLDRLGRSSTRRADLVHELESKGADLRVLEPEVSTKGPVGKMVLTAPGDGRGDGGRVIRERSGQGSRPPRPGRLQGPAR